MTESEKEILALKKELRESRLENEILKKQWASFRKKTGNFPIYKGEC